MTKNETITRTPECTILWPALFEPESFNGSEKKYRCVLLFEADADFTNIKTAIAAAREKKFPGKDREFYQTLRHPLRKGDEKAVDKNGKPDPESLFFGRVYLSAKSDFQPQIVDRSNQPITDAKLLYGGCRVVALLSFYGYEYLGNRGVSCSLLAVMKTDDGDPLGGGKVDTGKVFADYIKVVDPSARLKNVQNKADPGAFELDDIT
jgi:hypothetical protein